jgi:hypothetical protein
VTYSECSSHDTRRCARGHGQAEQTADDDSVATPDGAGTGQARHPLRQHPQRDRRLEARERLSEAVVNVNAAGERQVADLANPISNVEHQHPGDDALANAEDWL